MIKTLQQALKMDRERFKVPRSVQQAIPIRRIWPDGVFQSGTKFSKTFRFSDINYAIASKEDKTAMFLGYSELLNALDTGSTTKITIEVTADDDMGSIAEKLQDAGLIRSRIVPAAANGSSRKYYALTDKGRETLSELIAFWNEYTVCVDTFIRQCLPKEAEK